MLAEETCSPPSNLESQKEVRKSRIMCQVFFYHQMIKLVNDGEFSLSFLVGTKAIQRTPNKNHSQSVGIAMALTVPFRSLVPHSGKASSQGGLFNSDSVFLSRILFILPPPHVNHLTGSSASQLSSTARPAIFSRICYISLNSSCQ